MQHTPSVPTALVVDDSFGARARVTMLLRLGGWRVHQAVGTEDALRLAALIEPDLVVTDMVMRQGHGATLMRRLREEGSSARFLVMAARRTHQTRALAAAAGALACLAKPVDPRLFVDVLRGLAPDGAMAPARDDAAPPPPRKIGPHAVEMFAGALPHRLSAIAISAQAGDAAAVAVAADARRGVMAHARVVELQALAHAG